MGFPRQEYWSGLLFPSPDDLPDPAIEPMSLAWQEDSWTLSHLGCPKHIYSCEITAKFLCSYLFLSSLLRFIIKHSPNCQTSLHFINLSLSALIWSFLMPSIFTNFCGLDGKESACSAGDPGSIPGLGRSPGEGNGNPRQYSCLENSMNRRAWQAIVPGVAKSHTGLRDYTYLFTYEAFPNCLWVHFFAFWLSWYIFGK